MVTNEELKNELKEGMIVSGSVTNIQPYGAFIKTMDGQLGFLPIQNISVSRIKSPSERLTVGQKLDVMVEYVGHGNEKYSFSLKELYGTWEENVQNFKERTVVTGIARDTDKLKNGIFVELTPNLVGLADYDEDIEYGQEVKVYIKRIIPEKKKIKLSFIKEDDY